MQIRKFQLTIPLALALLSPAVQAFGEKAMLARMDAQLSSRFQQADVNHDGLLTREEAQAGMPLVAQRFDEIDTTRKGTITLVQLRAFMQTEMAQRTAAQEADLKRRP